jgi:hypothetical protein
MAGRRLVAEVAVAVAVAPADGDRGFQTNS